MADVEFIDEGEKVVAITFKNEAYSKLCRDVYDRIDILSKHDECVSAICKNFWFL